jgi:hypothetical protein
MFHRPRLRRIGLRIESGRGFFIDQHDRNAAPAEFIGEHEPAGATTGDDDLGLIGKAHAFYPAINRA